MIIRKTPGAENPLDLEGCMSALWPRKQAANFKFVVALTWLVIPDMARDTLPGRVRRMHHLGLLAGITKRGGPKNKPRR